jgi:ankyrin repeat protein
MASIIKSDHYFAFLMACEKGQISFLEHMKESGLTKNDMKKKVCQEAVLRATKNGQVEVLKFLHSAFCFDKSDLINLAFIEACEYGYLDVLKCFRETYNLEYTDVTERYNNAFIYACENDHLEIVKYLHVNFGVTREILGKDMIEALKSACLKGHLEIVKYLHVNFGVTREILGKDMIVVALISACLKGHLEIVKYLHVNFGVTDDEMSEVVKFTCQFNLEINHYLRYYWSHLHT